MVWKNPSHPILTNCNVKHQYLDLAMCMRYWKSKTFNQNEQTELHWSLQGIVQYMESYSRPFPFWPSLSGDSLVRQCNYQSGPYRKIGTNRWPNKIRIKATLAAVQTFSGSFTTLGPPVRAEIVKIILSMRKRIKQARLETTVNGEYHNNKRTLNTNGMLWLEMKNTGHQMASCRRYKIMRSTLGETLK